MRPYISSLSSRKILTVSTLVAAWVCVAVTGHAFGEAYSPPPFAHYQPILDRMPFGLPPANAPAAAVDPATLKSEAQEKAEQQALAKKINMSAVNITPDGKTAIGFTDLSQNPPVNYFLLVGAEAGGWTVLSADYDEESATIEKEGVTITLKLGKGLVAPAAPAAPATPGRPAVTAPPAAPAATGIAQMPDPRVPHVGVTRVPLPMNPAAAQAGDARSYAERQLERASQQTAAQAAARAEQQAQLEKLASEAAASAIKRREEEAAQAAQAAQAEDPQGQVQ